MALPIEVITTIGLVGGYAVATTTKKRELGGAVLAGAGAIAGKRWKDALGGPASFALGLIYTGSFGASHPLAKKIGAWPAVLSAAGMTAAASLVAGRVLAKK
ncbi:hypothetical protein EH165_01440 [Nakamurella antarctica]|uniref:Uncharacterized protein n=1 Tax=Nakamurella antarctica TaxID=1902245 RepID=A0A3G8ZIJ3_9ACTN|nr:hypothetical protein [Nakamurella antarctica]AZI57030.1 hypothetical protein EH165_01440 [Nakamurella antarctica]